MKWLSWKESVLFLFFSLPSVNPPQSKKGKLWYDMTHWKVLKNGDQKKKEGEMYAASDDNKFNEKRKKKLYRKYHWEF